MARRAAGKGARTAGGTRAASGAGATGASRAASSSRRDEVLALAAGLFADRGYRATTVRDIADAAGVLSGSLYYHFDSKESMVDELLSSFLGDLLSRYRAIAASDASPSRQLERLIEESFDSIPRHRAAIVIYQQDGQQLALQPRFAYIREISAENEAIWLRVIERGAESGELVMGSPRLTYQFLRDAVWTSVRWFQLGGSWTTRDLSGQFMHMVMAGLAPR
jgi:AcrR family transcriptional regulator